MKAQNLEVFIKRIILCSSNEGDIVLDPLDFAQGKF
jgi:DNA modification methylase